MSGGDGAIDRVCAIGGLGLKEHVAVCSGPKEGVWYLAVSQICHPL